MNRGKVWTCLPQKKEDLIKVLNGMPDEMGVVICDGYEETITPIADVVIENVVGVGKECIVLVGAHPTSKDINNINKQENTGISDLWNILDKSRYTREGISRYEEEYLFLKGVLASLGIGNTRKLLNMFDGSFGETYKMIVHLTGIDKESESVGNSNALNKLLNAGKDGGVSSMFEGVNNIDDISKWNINDVSSMFEGVNNIDALEKLLNAGEAGDVK